MYIVYHYTIYTIFDKRMKYETDVYVNVLPLVSMFTVTVADKLIYVHLYIVQYLYYVVRISVNISKVTFYNHCKATVTMTKTFICRSTYWPLATILLTIIVTTEYICSFSMGEKYFRFWPTISNNYFHIYRIFFSHLS